VKSPVFLACATVALILACAAPQKEGKVEATDKTAPDAMVLVSAAFLAGESIPTRYSLYGENLSPDLTWDKVPEGTRSFALICRDPDAPSGTFYHWVLFNVPEEVRGLPEGIGRDVSLPTGGTQATNSFRQVGYDGPKPPTGTHRYYFDLYALDRMLELDQTATAGTLLEAMKGHVLGKASLMGKYRK
jgi:Raf kinase inhibitor-like YbhB/YbcL family protein